MSETTEQRLAALEKEVAELKNESHKILSESARAMLTLQQRLTSVRGPEGGRGEKGEPGRDGISASEIQSIISQALKDFERRLETEIFEKHSAALGKHVAVAEATVQKLNDLKASMRKALVSQAGA